MVDEFVAQPFHVAGAVVEVVDLTQRHGAVPVEDALRQLEQVVSAGEADHRVDDVLVDGFALADALVEDGEGVAQGAVRQAGNEVRGAGGELEPLFRGDVGDARGDVFGRDAVEVEALAPGQDGGGQLVDFGRGQHELDVFGRLFEGLQQRVEGAGGEHVDLVDDVHPVLAADRREVRLVADLTDVVDAVVGGGVYFDDVQDGARVDALAGLAAVAGVAVHGMLAVDRLREDFGTGGLARSPGTGEQIGVGMAPGAHLVHEGPGDMLLSDDVGEDLRPPFAVQGLICFCHETTVFLTRNKIAYKKSEAAFP